MLYDLYSLNFFPQYLKPYIFNPTPHLLIFHVPSYPTSHLFPINSLSVLPHLNSRVFPFFLLFISKPPLFLFTFNSLGYPPITLLFYLSPLSSSSDSPYISSKSSLSCPFSPYTSRTHAQFFLSPLLMS